MYLPVELVELEKVQLMPDHESKRLRVSFKSKVNLKLSTRSRVKANI